MKKYLLLVGNILLYSIILYVVFKGETFLIFNVFDEVEFLRYFILQTPLVTGLIIFASVVLIYSLLFMLKGKNLFKICSFTGISPKNIAIIAITGGFVALFTTSFTGISFVREAFPVLPGFMDAVYRIKGPFAILFAVILLIPFFEEIIFRGVYFNELRANIPLTAAIVLQAVIYGIFQMELIVGIYAVFASVLYALPYIWTRSLWSSVLIQNVSALCILLLWNFGYKFLLENLGDIGAVSFSAMGLTGFVAGLYFLNGSCKAKQTASVQEVNA